MNELEGRAVVVTGANSGVGRSLSELLIDAGAHVVMVCRDQTRGASALDALTRRPASGTAELEIADLADFESVRALGERLRRFDAIEALVNNAGVWRTRREKNPAGLELTMATNHLGHFLLTDFLLEGLRAGGRRIVNVSSGAHRRGDLNRAPVDEIISGEAWKGGLQAYSDSKLANVLFSAELVRRYGGSGLIANSLHPGVLRTGIWNKTHNPLTLLMRLFKPAMGSPAVGGRAILRLLVDPALSDVTDSYFDVEEISEVQPQGRDQRIARDLWDASARLTGVE